MNSTPTLDAVTESLLGALDDGPGLSDLTPPVGEVLAALGAKPARRETPIRDTANPWVCSVRFEGESASKFLVGNASLSSSVPLVFTSDGAQAMHASTQGWFTFGWPYLIASHGRAIGKRVQAVVHRLNDTPEFAA